MKLRIAAKSGVGSYLLLFSRWTLGFALFVLGLWLVPHWWCERESDRWYRGDKVLQERLGNGVERWVSGELGLKDFTTGNLQFDGEWLFGSYLMAGMGFGQTALEHPEWREQRLKQMSACIDKILTPEVRAFDRNRWDEDPIDTLDGHREHAAYLGYFNLLLSLHRLLDANSPYAQLNDRITAALVRRLENSPLLLMKSYPHEVYPMDNCAAIGSIGLYDRATKADHRALLQRWSERCRRDYVDHKTGLLIQCVDETNGFPLSVGRGSGTALGLYFLSFGAPELSRELFQAVESELVGGWLGFGLVREYPRAFKSSGWRDIDSGPIICGWGISATGFSIGGSRIHGRKGAFSSIYATAHLFGAPVDSQNRRDYTMGGPLGNAIMFGMLTAQPALKDLTTGK